MGSQRKNSSLDAHLLGPRWLLTAFLLAPVLPVLSLSSLLCYYCPVRHKGEPCVNVTSQCLPGERCSSSRGHFGSLHILSAQGCVDAELCGSQETISYRGVKFNVSHTCCCKDKCNGQPKSGTSLKMLLGMIADKIDYKNITNVLREALRDSCANSTSERFSALPAAAA